tara:strand:+ start:8611 stop:9087 length:477 start_codon:yes stop_codon:yes gene_type:complete
VVVVSQSVNRYSENIVSRKSAREKPFYLIRKSLSSKKLSRQYPFLSASHKAIDGTLLGVLLAVTMLAFISLHTQHLWTLSFSRLQSSRDLIQKLKESISVLENHFDPSKNLTQLMVPTKTSNLIYLERPDSSRKLTKNYSQRFNPLEKLLFYPAKQAY